MESPDADDNSAAAREINQSVEQWLRGSSVEDALKMQKPARDDAIVMRPPEKKSA